MPIGGVELQVKRRGLHGLLVAAREAGEAEKYRRSKIPCRFSRTRAAHIDLFSRQGVDVDIHALLAAQKPKRFLFCSSRDKTEVIA